MRILQVSSADEYGGGERHVTDLVRALIERGHELHVAVRPQSPLRRELEDTPTIVWHELPLRGAIDPQSAAGLARVIRENKIDIVHAHVARDYPISGFAAKLTRTPFVLTRHHFNRLKGGRFYPSILGNSCRLIAVSRSVAATLADALPSELADRIVVIPNWINFNESRPADRAFAREALGIKRPLAIGIAGKITPLKGHMLFLQMAKRLMDENGSLDIDFVVAGDSQPRDKKYESELRAFVESAGLGGSVRFVGFVPQIDRLFSGIRHYRCAFRGRGVLARSCRSNGSRMRGCCSRSRWNVGAYRRWSRRAARQESRARCICGISKILDR